MPLPRLHGCSWAAALAAVACAATPSLAHGHTPETEAVAHAQEHAELLRIAEGERARLAAMTPAQRRAERRAEAARAEAIQAADPPARIGGKWSAPFPHRSFGMHSAVLPTGKVLFYSLPLGKFQSQHNEGLAWLWDPKKGKGSEAFENVDPPMVDTDGDGVKESAPLYCSGQSFLPDGRLLMTGGNIRWPDYETTHDYVGWEAVFTFDPFTEQWKQESSMRKGRWYPTQVLAPDGSTLILGGFTEDAPGGIDNMDIERFNLDGTVEKLGEIPEEPVALYPHLFTLSTGLIGVAGPTRGDVATIDPRTGVFKRDIGEFDGAWILMGRNRVGGTAVLEPGKRDSVMNIGGYDGQQPNPRSATASTESIDFTPKGGFPRWTDRASLNVGRSYHNTVLLPDGGMVTVGGGRGFSAEDGARWTHPAGEARPVELLARGGTSWRLGAAQAEDRGYHSVALLLPDGRVMSSGDDVNPNFTSDTIELYSPPYLFKGKRPKIGRAPKSARYGRSITIRTRSRAKRVVLMAPGATTHGVDMSQRHVQLKITRKADGRRVVAKAPRNANLAPPGWHMLFILDRKGVPSVAKWVRLAR